MRSRSLLLPLLLGMLLAGCDRGAGRTALPADAELRALVDSMLPSLARLASLAPREEVRIDRRDSAQVREFVAKRLEQELPAAALDALRSTYALLGLVPDSLDLRALLLGLYTEQIVGYYDPGERTLHVVEGVAPATLAPVLAHELVHALQDQHADLDSLIAPGRGNDPRTAAHAALEGHATLVMFAYLAEQAEERALDPAALPNPATELAAGLDAQNSQFPVFRTAPAIIRETLLFPYIGGADFMHQLWQAERLDRPAPLGRWLPASTEQVLHPRERFLRERDAPTALRIGDAAGGWRTVGEDDGLGELETAIFLEQHLGAAAREFARGWDGDVYRLLEDQRGQRALVWFSVWDGRADADRFVRAVHRVARVLRERTFAVASGEVAGKPSVRVVVSRTGTTVPADALPRICLDSGGRCVL
jgi:hypothetical protein